MEEQIRIPVTPSTMPDLLKTDVSFTSRQELLDLRNKPPDEDVGVDSQSHSPNGSAPRSPSSLGADVSAHSAVSTGATSFQGQFFEPDPAQCGHSVTEQDSELLCGWGSLRPKALQVFNTHRWFLLFLSMGGLLQAVTINGLVNAVITTLERRFGLSSSETGLIVSSYDIASCVGLPFVSYFGGNGHKPRWLGCGFIIMGLGAFIFALPHFTTPPYQVTAPEKSLLCLANSTDFSQNKAADGLSNYYYVFVLGQLLHGLGAAPLFTLGFTFLDENVKATNAPVFMGVLYTVMALSPAVGMLLAGFFLNFHTDLIQTPEMTPQSPLWVGAWWIGFLLAGTLCFPVGFAILSYPRKLPGSQETTATCEAPQDKEKSHTTASDPEFGQTLRDMPKVFLHLCSNPTFICLCLAIAPSAALIAALSGFMIKYIEYQFRFTSTISAVIFGAIAVPASGGGTFIGSYIVKRFKLQVRGLIKFCLGCTLFGVFSKLVFLIHCPTVSMAGVTVPYTSSQIDGHVLDLRQYNSLQQLHSSSLDDRLTAQCNSNCSCDKQKFSPVCGADDVMYFSPCYAGCSSINTTAGGEVFSGCSCVVANVSSDREGLAVAAQCEGSCSSETAAFLSIFAVLVCNSVCLCRCVTESQKSFALGIQWILVRTLGAIPAPIVFGALYDQACLLRNQTFCLLYENSKMSFFTFIICVIYRVRKKFLLNPDDRSRAAWLAGPDRSLCESLSLLSRKPLYSGPAYEGFAGGSVVGTFFYILALVFHQRSARPQLQQNSEHTQGGATVKQQQTRM
ncbi:hypothetical protein WMY93_027829 [Mugilogobius chulae]|uniref:Solute carrier organic anion transporter family member n=1 Tax=Mugilogobius chulae TaxID=88201 RepID=A0AAW0MV61_9GOBI